MITTSDENIMEEVNEINIYEEEATETGNDAAEIVAEPLTPKRRSFLSALGRRILSFGRKQCCCGGGTRNRQ